MSLVSELYHRMITKRSTTLGRKTLSKYLYLLWKEEPIIEGYTLVCITLMLRGNRNRNARDTQYRSKWLLKVFPCGHVLVNKTNMSYVPTQTWRLIREFLSKYTVNLNIDTTIECAPENADSRTQVEGVAVYKVRTQDMFLHTLLNKNMPDKLFGFNRGDD